MSIKIFSLRYLRRSQPFLGHFAAALNAAGKEQTTNMPGEPAAAASLLLSNAHP
jgi:hypothetical protein